MDDDTRRVLTFKEIQHTIHFVVLTDVPQSVYLLINSPLVHWCVYSGIFKNNVSFPINRTVPTGSKNKKKLTAQILVAQIVLMTY